MKIIYHRGTGTWFAADDNVVVIDTDLLPNKDSDLIDVLESEGDDIAEQYGHALVTAPYTNLLFVDANALRIEVRDKLESAAYRDFRDADENILRWAADAPDDDLSLVGELMLNNDKMWEYFNEVLWDALYEAYTMTEASKTK